MAFVDRLTALGMAPELANEVATQEGETATDAATALAGVVTLTPTIAAVTTPAAYSTVAADLAAVLVSAGLMEPEA